MLAGLSVPRDPEALEHALEGLAALDAYLIRKHDLPPLVETGAIYKREPQESWRNALQVIAEGWGDCEDLAAYRVGWLRVHEAEPARIILVRTGPNTLHAKVLRANGRTEDPSIWLGMKRGRKRNA